MIRGEFIRADGLVIPNNVMTYGVKSIFQWALRDENYSLFMGLANCNPDPELQIEDLNEPTLATNGYDRIEIPRTTGWPVFGELNGETYYETSVYEFEASGAGFDKPINRIVLINSEDATAGQLVVALSGPLPEEVTITAATPLEDRSFKYRIYGR